MSTWEYLAAEVVDHIRKQSGQPAAASLQATIAELTTQVKVLNEENQRLRTQQSGATPASSSSASPELVARMMQQAQTAQTTQQAPPTPIVAPMPEPPLAAFHAAVGTGTTSQPTAMLNQSQEVAESAVHLTQGGNRAQPAAAVEADIPPIEFLVAGFERGGRAQVLQRLEFGKKLTTAGVQAKIRGLGLSPAKTAQMQTHAEELVRRLTRRAPKTEIEALKRGLEDLCCQWGLRANLLSTCNDYTILAKLVACAVMMDQ